MKKNSFSSLSDSALLKRINLLKAVLTAFGFIYIAIIVVLLYLFYNKNFGQLSVAIFVPILVLPAVWTPLFISYNILKKERIGRDL
jgi:hypothetical protein